MADEITTLMNNSKDKIVLLRLRNTKTIQGILKDFDIHMNLTLEDAEDVTDEKHKKIFFTGNKDDIGETHLFSIDFNGMNIMHYAAEHGYTQVIKLLYNRKETEILRKLMLQRPLPDVPYTPANIRNFIDN